MEGKIFCLFSAILAVSSSRTIPQEGVDIPSDDSIKIEPRIFENKILEAINVFKDLLAYGDPQTGIPPLDPFFLDYKSFDFIIKDTALKGHLESTTFANFSRFEPVKVEFKLLPLHFKLEIFIDQIHVDGRYKLLGNFFNELPLNGTGIFTLETKNLTLMLHMKPTKVNSSLQIKDLIFEYKIESEKISYTNELLDDKVHELDEKLALYVLDNIQKKYAPPLIKMVKEVLNHFLLGISFNEIIQMILDFLNKSKIYS